LSKRRSSNNLQAGDKVCKYTVVIFVLTEIGLEIETLRGIKVLFFIS
jgi:hypothetical protein